MIKLKHILLLPAVLLFACGPQGNKDQENKNLSKDPQIEVGDDVQMDNDAQDLLINANMNSQLQIALSEAALNKSSSSKINALSNQILTENKVIQNNLLALAEAAGIDMAPSLSLEYVALLDSIQTYSGDHFDSAFVATVIEEQEDDIKEFTRLSEKVQDPIIRAQITDILEIMTAHLDAAKEIQRDIE